MPARSFTVDARAILGLGRQAIKCSSTAIIELIKNSYDADASTVLVEFNAGPSPNIVVSDDGCGMSEPELEACWLRIGASEKLENTTTESNRRRTGEKGIGRLSADRLGAILEIKTAKERSDPIGVRVDWSEFEVQGRDIGEIIIADLDDPAPEIPLVGDGVCGLAVGRPGTQLIIRELRDRWGQGDIEQVISELETFVSPHAEGKGFSIYVSSESFPQLGGLIESRFVDAALVELTAELMDDDTISYTLHDRAGGTRELHESGSEDFTNITALEAPVESVGDDSEGGAVFKKIGPVSVRYWFYQEGAESLRDLSISKKEIRAFLNASAGVGIYRDDIRVKPYGQADDPAFDWLGLGARKARDPAGAARKTWKVSPRQLVGAIYLTRDNSPDLADSSAREGMVQGVEFALLRAMCIGCLRLLEARYHELFTRDKIKKEKPEGTLMQRVGFLRKSLGRLQVDLRKVGEDLNRSDSRRVRRVAGEVLDVLESLDQSTSEIEELANQHVVMRTLASVGIASAAYGHETLSSLDLLKTCLLVASGIAEDLPEDEDVHELREEVNKARAALVKVTGWGSFALSRVRRDKRKMKKVDISKLVGGLMQELRPVYLGSTIDLVPEVQSNVEARCFVMDVEAVLINLLTNAYESVLRSTKTRRIEVAVCRMSLEGLAGFVMEVSDSGGGIAKRFQDKIWDPLFTTKTDDKGSETGTGLGLTIVQSIVLEAGGTVDVAGKGRLGGASFKIWIPTRLGGR